MRRKSMVVLSVVTSVMIAVAAGTTAWAGTWHRQRRVAETTSGFGVIAVSPRPSAIRPAGRPATSATSSSAVPSATGEQQVSPPASTPSPTPGSDLPAGRVFFDDFDYQGDKDSNLASRGWRLRDTPGGPGVAGATWVPDAVGFQTESVPGASADNTVLRLRSSTAGTAATTAQAELGTAEKFLAGTYASRIWFSDAPTAGSGTDPVVQTFFPISPLRYDDDPEYSELDFEYLPNGGWGAHTPTLYLTTWHTYHNKPSWGGDSVVGTVARSLQGWHDLVIQVGGGTVTYYLDGIQVFSSGGQYYPRALMAIQFNQWFVDGQLNPGVGLRSYEQKVDWVYHVADQVLAPDVITSQVNTLRSAKVVYRDTM